MEGNGIFPCIGEKWQFKTLQNLEIDLPRHKNDPEKIIYHVDFLGELENLKSQNYRSFFILQRRPCGV